MGTEQDEEEIEYGKWNITDAKAFLEEEKRLPHPKNVAEIWPHWSEGRPTKLRRRVESPPFTNGAVCHRYTEYYATVEYDWNSPHTWVALSKNYGLLPGTYTTHWSGVYRAFASDITIDRCCGKDPTGTLYIGRAGGGGRNWSILRNRIMSLAKRDHHATNNWSFSDLVQQKFPWNSLAVEWAFTGQRLNYKGEPEAEAKLAEGLLLNCYKESYGELPPWNRRV